MTPPDSSRKLYLALYPGHDASVSVVDEEGTILFATAEQYFSRNKDDMGFPSRALRYVEKTFGTHFEQTATIRLGKFHRLLRDAEFLFDSVRRGLRLPSPLVILRGYLDKLGKGRAVERGIGDEDLGWLRGESLTQISHHDAHAASAYFACGIPGAATMTLDGQGDDRYSSGFYQGKGASLVPRRMFFLNDVDVGYAYILTTGMLGLHAGRHAGKVTGLAGWNEWNEACGEEFERFLSEIWRKKPAGGHLTYANYLLYHPQGKAELRRIRQERFGRFSDRELACTVQRHLERRVLARIEEEIEDPRGTDLALAGGVFANVRLNQKIKQLGFRSIFVQPAMGDSGLSLGAAKLMAARFHGALPKRLDNVYLGPSFGPDAIARELNRLGVAYSEPSCIEEEAAKRLAEGKTVARYDGRIEFGPRALGNRSILYRTDDPAVNIWLNEKLRRSEFMPFAPVTLAEEAPRMYRGLEGAREAARFMTITFDCTEEMKRLSPACVHVDGTARPQILSREENPGYYAILETYHKLTGSPTLINTSFNMHEEPIVLSPEDAVRGFRAAELDCLAIGPFLVEG